MGNKQSRSVGAADPMVTVPLRAPAPTLVQYDLNFRATLVNNATRHATEEEKVVAREAIKAAPWQDYLHSIMLDTLMKDALVEEVSFRLVTDIDTEEAYFGPVTMFEGVLSWRAEPCDQVLLKEQIDWFIGDRMSQYEFDEDSWHMYIKPGGLGIRKGR